MGMKAFPQFKENEMTRKSLHYAVDLDGTLATYDRWRGVDHIGEPIEPMVRHVKELLANGDFVTIFTARVAPEAARNESCDRAREVIAEWCRMHIGQELPITAVKLPVFHAILDDRAEQILPNDGRNAALAFHELAKDCINIMIDQGMDPIILQQRFHELSTKLMRDKETL